MQVRAYTKKHFLWILLGAIAIYCVLFSVVSSLRHYNFQTQTWDMGVFVQTFWNSARGRLMENTLEEAPNTLGVHMSPWLLVLVPGYMLFSSPYFLLVIQTLALGLGALPLYYLGKSLVGDERVALALTGAYLLYPSLHWVNLFDFHAVSFFVPFMLATFYYIDQGRLGPASCFAILAASTREDATLVVALLGIVALIMDPRQPKKEKKFWTPLRIWGGVVALAALIYFFVSIKILMPALGGGLLRIDRYAQFGSSISEILTTISSNPFILIETIFTQQKILYLLWLFVPVAFLPILSGRMSLLLLPGLLENLLTDFPLQFSGIYQYDSVLIPSIFICSLYGARWLLARKKEVAAKLCYGIFIFACVGFLVRSPLNPFFFPSELFGSTPHWDSLRRIVPMIPPDVSVAAHTNLVPHLAHRQHLSMLGQEPSDVDILVVDGKDPFGFKDFDAFEKYISEYLEKGDYVVHVVDDRYAIIARKNITLLK